MANLKTLAILGLMVTFSAGAQSALDGSGDGKVRTRVRKVSRMEGINVGMLTSLRDVQISASGLQIENDIKNNIGLILGYTSIPRGRRSSLGFKGSISYGQGEVDFSQSEFELSLNELRAEANAATALTRATYVFGGLNIVQFNGNLENTTSGANDEFSTDLGLGYQIGMGTQINRNLALEARFVSTRGETTEELKNLAAGTPGFASGVDLEASGLEINLIGTF